MTDLEARRKVAEDIYRESLPIATVLGIPEQQEVVATAFAKLSGNIINRYLLYILADADQAKGRAS